MASADRTGVLLIGGFLGAGKTTLLRRLVRDPQVGGRIAVLVNELGALGLDGELVRAASESATLRTVQLDSGCLCCTLKGALGDALVELARPASGPPPAQIVVELSGAALASEVHFHVATQALEAPFYADGLVCLVDAQAAPRWAREAEGLFLDQLTRADLVLLTKLDAASAAERAATEALLERHAAGARVVACTRGDVDPLLLLGALTPAPPTATAPSHAHALVGVTRAVDGPLHVDALEALLEACAESLYRIKGLVDVVDRDGGAPRPTLVQCVGDQIMLSPAEDARGGVRRLIFIGPAEAPLLAGDGAELGRSLDAARLVGGVRSA